MSTVDRETVFLLVGEVERALAAEGCGANLALIERVQLSNGMLRTAWPVVVAYLRELDTAAMCRIA